MRYYSIKIRSCLLFIVLLASTAFSQPVKPHTFSPLDPVSSAKINANFDTIYQWGSVASAAIELHKADTAAHGATGAVVGTTNTQTLTNKSISGEQINSGTVADERVASTLARDSEVTSAVSTHAGLTATHGATGAVMGTTNTQTVTNKTLDSTNSVDGGAIKTGTVADARLASTLARWGATGADANAVTNSGFFHASANIPTTDGESDKALIHNQYGGGSTWATQIAQSWRNGRAWIRNKEGGAWEPWHEIWTTNNDGSGSGLDADLLDGYHVSATAHAANTIPVRNASGYLYLGWINTTSGDSGITTPTRIYASNDSFLRYYTPANFKTVMGLNYGTAASTVCEGNDSRLSDARTPLAHNQDGSTITSGEIPAARITSRYANYTAPFNTGSGTPRSYQSAGLAVCFVQGAHGWPISYGMLLNIPSYASSEDGGAMQILVPYSQGYTTGGRFMYRVGCYNNAGWTSWRTIFDDSAVVPLANGGTNASDAATARTNLGLGSAATLTASTSGTASAVAQRDSSGDITTRLFRSTYAEQTTAPATTADIAFRNNTSDNYIRFMDAAAFKAWMINSKIGVVQTSAPASPVDGDIWVE